mmetsp:Transcript_37441/g.66555  ORF Transcript_37441/g.66555 Transcript_37441/m.66555 type:complete len:738 (+) Transcript_37441:84-2297(+)
MATTTSQSDFAGHTIFDELLRRLSQEYFSTLERSQELVDTVESLTAEVEELRHKTQALQKPEIAIPAEDEQPMGFSERLGSVFSGARWLGPGMQFRQTTKPVLPVTPAKQASLEVPLQSPQSPAFSSQMSGQAASASSDPMSFFSPMRTRFGSNQSNDSSCSQGSNAQVVSSEDFRGELVEHIGSLLRMQTRNLETKIEERFDRLAAWSNENMEAIEVGSLHSVEENKKDQRWRKSLDDHDDALKASALHSASQVFASEDESDDDDLVRRQSMSRRLGYGRVRLKAFVSHTFFELTFAIIIVSNAIYLGIETDYMAKNRVREEQPPALIYAIQLFYTVVFTIELALRWIADGSNFLWSHRNWAWNWLDTLTVVASLVETTFTTIQRLGNQRMDVMQGVGNVRLIRIIRVARLLRVFRISRILRFVSSLRTLVYSIIGTLTSLFWAIVLLILIMYTFGVVFTQAAGDHLADKQSNGDALKGSDDTEQSLKDYWGTLSTSMFTLFMSIAAGISWEYVVDPLADVSLIWAALFSGFIAFTYFAVLNIVTANFCQSAIDSAQHDQEMIIHSVIRQKRVYVNLLKRLFRQIDDNGSGQISLRELDVVFQNKEVKAYFSSLDLEPDDAWMLFKLLDADKGASLDMDEFVAGCMRLRGNAKKLDLARLIEENNFMARQLSDFMDHADKQFQQLKTFTRSMVKPHWANAKGSSSSLSKMSSKIAKKRLASDSSDADQIKEDDKEE